jgi:hypothetical protein
MNKHRTGTLLILSENEWLEFLHLIEDSQSRGKRRVSRIFDWMMMNQETEGPIEREQIGFGHHNR